MTKEKQIKVVIIEPKKAPRVEMIENTLEAKQKIVGGDIEVIRYSQFDLIVNEEGHRLELEPNFGIGTTYVLGTAFYVGVDYDEGEFKSLDEKWIQYILSCFKERK